MSEEKNDMDIEEIIASELKEKKEEFVIPKGGMKIYYENFFPYEMYFSWLGRGEVEKFQSGNFLSVQKMMFISDFNHIKVVKNSKIN